MRTIDADALKELFSEVIGRIAIKPEMNGNLEHMIRASAMVIQMIDDAPTVQPDTTTHDSIPVETGKKDDYGTSGDCINRQQAINKIKPWLEVKGYSWGELNMLRAVINELENMPSAQPETCEGCKHLGKWENEVEYGYPSPCTRCKRRVNDNYER